MDGIAKLRGISTWPFVQTSRFPGQGDLNDKVYVFKMSEVGRASGVDLVRRMQPGQDLEKCWMMFDHVKRVPKWTTMACHVYDPKFRRVLTIACCEFQCEDTSTQVLFWQNLNAVAIRNGVLNPNFAGFMADTAQANWNAVRIVYGTGKAEDKMVERERTCDFHWVQSLESHCKSYIDPPYHEQFMKLTRQYKNAPTIQKATELYTSLMTWLGSSKTTSAEGLKHLEDWLIFWHHRYRQWGGFMELVRSLFFSPFYLCL